MTMHGHANRISCAPSAAASPAYAEELKAAWREALEESESAYHAWCEARAAQRRLAYAAFLAATDREAAAEQAFLVTTSHA